MMRFNYRYQLLGLLGALTTGLLWGCTPSPNPVPDPDSEKASDITGKITLPGTGIDQTKAGQSIPNQFIVKIQPGVSAKSLQSLTVKGQNLVLAGSIPAWNLALYQAKNHLSKQTSQNVLAALKNMPHILEAEPNLIVQSFKTPNDTMYKLQWDAKAINMPKAWDITTGKQVNIAVIDSGIVKHPDLNSNILPGVDMITDPTFAGDGDGRDYDPTDLGDLTQYHGTHVAGTIAAIGNNNQGIAGINWKGKIVPVRVLGKNGSGNLFDVVQGIAWAAGIQVKGLKINANPAKIINMSLGVKSSCTKLYQDAFNELTKANIIPVIAAGNNNDDAKFYMPANCNNVITVGATDPQNKRAFYSNYGSNIDLMAPGGDNRVSLNIDGKLYPAGIYSTVLNKDGQPDYAPQQGTSMAAPHVAGAIALLLGKQPNLTFSQVKTKLLNAAEDLGNKCDKPCGAGLLNVATLLQGSSVPNPIPTPPETQKTQIIVSAFYQNDDGSIDRNRKVSTTVAANTLEIPYQLKQIEKGKYLIQAFQDLNNNGSQEDNEPIGEYEQAVIVDGKGLDISNIDFSLKESILPVLK